MRKLVLKRLEKIDIFEKVGKKLGQNGWREIIYIYIHFLNSWVPRKRGKGRYSQKYEKSENHCTLVVSLDPNMITGLLSNICEKVSSSTHTAWPSKYDDHLLLKIITCLLPHMIIGLHAFVHILYKYDDKQPDLLFTYICTVKHVGKCPYTF